ncbi:hypothetical protein HQ487_05490 [Candidatus Uhrbacteria bacterium]|nr:hypothetical protein [Candidatus Uhrbacteria bacterium]
MFPMISSVSKHIGDILTHAIEFTADHEALVIYDLEAPLTKIITDGYRAHLPESSFLNIADTSAEALLARFKTMRPGDLVILVQSTSFRLNEFRIRIELFQQELKTIEHIHLGRMDESQFETYVDSLAYNPDDIRPLGHDLKKRIDSCQRITVECPETTLFYETPFELSKLNIGDYSQMKNVGGTYPIGEVFSEPQDLTNVNGDIKIFAFAGKDHLIREYEPFLAHIKDGILSAPNAPEEFRETLTMIEEESPVFVREFGLGLNRAMGKGHLVNDLTAFERMRGMHMSLGAKHSIYKKPGMSRKSGRYHVDIFLDLERITIDDEVIFQKGDYTFQPPS